MPDTSLRAQDMQFRLSSTKSLAGLVAAAAISFATYLAFVREGSPFLGLLILVASVSGVAWIRITQEIAEHRRERGSVTRRWLTCTVVTSLVASTLIVGLSDVAFLLAYGLLLGGPRFFLMSASAQAEDISPVGLIAGSVVGLAVCCLSRWAFRRSGMAGERLLRSLGPMTVVLLLFSANVLSERTWYRLDRAENHDTLVGIYGGESSLPTPPPRAVDFRPRAELIEFHERMRRKWRSAAARPWLPVEPDPTPPGQ
jgi:multisubunit Na+/H+ antiporter MnhB subunit